MRKLALELGGAFKWDGSTSHASLEAGGAVSGGKLAVSFDESDGFVGKILSGVKLDSEFDFGIGYSTEHGLYFVGSSTLAIQLPLHLDLGPVEINALTVSVGIEGQRFPNLARQSTSRRRSARCKRSSSRSASPPTSSFRRRPSAATSARLDLALGFKPPSGVGLSIDAGVVKGGGYLFHRPRPGRVRRRARADVRRLPDAQGDRPHHHAGCPTARTGFSLLIIITAEFGPGIQLGFGFTLLGVGGLLGLNRTMRLRALARRRPHRRVNSVMFPHDVVANAPRIISDLRAFFPPQRGHVPHRPDGEARLGHADAGQLSLGVIIEIPGQHRDPRACCAWRCRTEEVALIVLQVNFVGAIEFDKKRLCFFAALFDSRIVFLTLEGEMGVLARARATTPTSCCRVGGFHPRFSRRRCRSRRPADCSVSILNDALRADPRRRLLRGHLQHRAVRRARGALLRLQTSAASQGHLGLRRAVPVLAVPLHRRDLGLGLASRSSGSGCSAIRLRVHAGGPDAVAASRATAASRSSSSTSTSTSTSPGARAATRRCRRSRCMPLLEAELDKPRAGARCCRPATACSSRCASSIRPTTRSSCTRVGTLRVSQRAVPLDLTLDKVGNQSPATSTASTSRSRASGLAKPRRRVRVVRAGAVPGARRRRASCRGPRLQR